MKNLVKNPYTNAALTREMNENERIIDYLVNGEDSTKLSDKEKEILARYYFCYDLLSQKRSRHEVSNKLQAKYRISRAQAYRDIFNMQYVIGSSLSIDEGFYEKLCIDSILETIRMAKTKGDLRAKAQSERNLLLALGFPKSDDNRITPDMLQQNVLVITSDIAALGIERIPNVEQVVKKFMRVAKKKPVIEVEAEEDE